jgi:hypothetical protein
VDGETRELDRIIRRLRREQDRRRRQAVERGGAFDPILKRFVRIDADGRPLPPSDPPAAGGLPIVDLPFPKPSERGATSLF